VLDACSYHPWPFLVHISVQGLPQPWVSQLLGAVWVSFLYEP
jgi:hypothetical protein